MVGAIIKQGNKSVEANVVLDLGVQAPIVLHSKTGRLLGVERGGSITLLFDGVNEATFADMPVLTAGIRALETLTQDMLPNWTRYRPSRSSDSRRSPRWCLNLISRRGDSSTLIDSTEAARLGTHRAIYYNEGLGQIEKFHPYGLPDQAWLTQVQADLAARVE